MSFKIGDKVRCVTAHASHYLIQDKVYTVTGHKSVQNYPDPWLYLDGGEDYAWRQDRFVAAVKGHLDPIMTVPARRELKVGTYGALNIHNYTVDKDAGVREVVVSLGKHHSSYCLSVDDLDEIIFTLTQVREFLKDG